MPITLQTIPTANRQTFLIEQNVDSIDRALRLLEQLDDEAYRCCPASLAPHRVGGHMRHILEFYECFLEGLGFSHVDYDARRRDESVETSRTVAMERLRAVRERLRENRELRGDNIVWVRVEDAQSRRLDDSFLTSSVSRELQALSSHTIHHFALIAVTLRALGVEVDSEFGVAPSTRSHRTAKAVEAA